MPDGPVRRLKGTLAAALGMPAAAAVEALLRRTALRAGVAVVYHGLAERAGDPEQELSPPVERTLFERQLRHLSGRYDLVPASRLAAAARRRRRGERFPAAITFDDDLPSHVEIALPVLEATGATAAFFLTGASLDGPHPFWWERLQAVLDRGLEPPPPLSRDMTLVEMRAAVAGLPPAERDRFAAAVAELAGPPAAGSGMRAPEVERLARAGHEVGFHTRDHHPLTQLGGEELERALREGRDEVERAAGTAVDTIAYPYGLADGRVARAARAAGYAAGFTAEAAAVTPATDPHLVPRVEAACDSGGRLAWHLARALVRALGSGRESGRRVTDARRAVLGGRAGRVARRAAARPRVGGLDLGDLDATEPISAGFGFERGLPVDRHYIERFLEAHASDVRGRVLEIGDDEYTRRFGGDAVDAVDVLHASEGNPQATIVADLSDAPELPDASYDCVICTQTLLLIYDVRAAVATIRRIMRPGAVALVTVPGLSRVCRAEAEEWGDFWRFTSMSARRLFEEAFPRTAVEVETFGNVLAATAQLHGIAADELDRAKLDAHDPDFEVVIAVRAVREQRQ